MMVNKVRSLRIPKYDHGHLDIHYSSVQLLVKESKQSKQRNMVTVLLNQNLPYEFGSIAKRLPVTLGLKVLH